MSPVTKQIVGGFAVFIRNKDDAEFLLLPPSVLPPAAAAVVQMAGYPGPHTLPSVPSALYPPPATMMDSHHAHTHPRHHVHSHAQHLQQPHGHDMALWGSAMEVRLCV